MYILNFLFACSFFFLPRLTNFCINDKHLVNLDWSRKMLFVHLPIWIDYVVPISWILQNNLECHSAWDVANRFRKHSGDSSDTSSIVKIYRKNLFACNIVHLQISKNRWRLSGRQISSFLQSSFTYFCKSILRWIVHFADRDNITKIQETTRGVETKITSERILKPINPKQGKLG